MAIAYVICLVAYWLVLCRRSHGRRVTHSISSSSLERQRVQDELMRQIIGNVACRKIIRMGPKSFFFWICVTCYIKKVASNQHNEQQLKNKLRNVFNLSCDSLKLCYFIIVKISSLKFGDKLGFR